MTARSAKWRQRPPAPLPELTSDDIRGHEGRLWRIMRTSGPHALPWNQPRAWGPVQHSRWDPHHDPASPQPTRSVLYTATDVRTTVAEVFQSDRFLDVHTDDPFLIGFTPTRPLQLLDLTSTWLLRAGSTTSQSTAPRRACRAWAQQIRTAYPDLDGLWVPSTMTSTPVVVLYAPSVAALPATPEFSRPLAAGDTRIVVRRAAREIGYDTH